MSRLVSKYLDRLREIGGEKRPDGQLTKTTKSPAANSVGLVSSSDGQKRSLFFIAWADDRRTCRECAALGAYRLMRGCRLCDGSDGRLRVFVA